jgi:hypothetical protein
VSDPLAERGIDFHLQSFVCVDVINGQRPVLLVARDHEGDWCFLCGEEHEGNDYVRVAGIGHVITGDPALAEVLDLGTGEEAERSSVGAAWIRAPYGGSE